MPDFYVYIHRRATDGRAFYVGKGRRARAASLSMRNQHWHNIVQRDGRVVEYVEIGMTEDRAFELEATLIEFFGRRDLGTGELVNMTDGWEGSSGSRRDGEIAEKISAALRGRKRSPEAVAKTVRGLTGRTLKPEHAAALRSANVGRKVSDETKAKIRAAALGRKRTPESIAKSREGFIKTWNAKCQPSK